MWFCLLLHYAVYWSMAAFFNPEDEISIGLHEKVGPCDVYQDVHTAFGMVSTYVTRAAADTPSPNT